MYYQLRQTPVIDGLYMTVAPSLGRQVRWLSGTKHPVTIPTPIEVELDDRFGRELADLLDDNILVMSDAMVAALEEAGVDNFDAYDVILEDKKRGERFSGYKAVQVIGRVEAADLAASDAFDPAGVGHTVVQFRKLAIDESKAKDALMFRLHENASTLLIHDRVKPYLDAVDLKYVSIVPVGESIVPALDEDEPEE